MVEDKKEDGLQEKKKRMTLGVGGPSLDKDAIKARFLSGSSKDSIAVSVRTNRVVSYSVASNDGASDLDARNVAKDEARKQIDLTFSKAPLIQTEEQSQQEIGVKSDIASDFSSVNLDVPVLVEPVIIEDKAVVSAKPVRHVDKHKVQEQKEEPSVDDKAQSFRTKEKDSRRLHKANLMRLSQVGEDEIQTVRSLSAIKRAKEKAKRRNFLNNAGGTSKVYREILLSGPMVVSELAHSMSEKVSDVVRVLMDLGVIARANEVIDEDTIEVVVSSLGHTVKKVSQDLGVQALIQGFVDKDEDLEHRAPVVTIMGHVDHGKTSLLDALRKTDVVSGEAGGITQHMGAYQITSGDKLITVLDTPGHEAFSQMRKRGAQITDIIVIVIAADSGIKEQTIESIAHAKSAKIPIIVAINKIDKPGIDLGRIKNMLVSHDILPEEMGGDVLVVPVSAKAKTNLTGLTEAILLVAEMLQLKANNNVCASGVVIESCVNAATGVSATVLVRRGKLSVGDILVAGNSFGKVKRLVDHKGISVEYALPSTPVEVMGLGSLPQAGDQFLVVENEKKARSLVRSDDSQDRALTIIPKTLASSLSGGFAKQLFVLLKVDVQGSLDAIIGGLTKTVHEEVKLRILHSGVGDVNESDVRLAAASRAIILTFNAGAITKAAKMAKDKNVEIKSYKIVYDLLNEVKSLLNEMLSPIEHEKVIGTAIVLQVFEITKFGKVAGCKVKEGLIKRGYRAKVLRDGKQLGLTSILQLKRQKDDVKEVKESFECGIGLERFTDIREGDVIECIEVTSEKQKFF
jgi:translation initiation factor IF-2